jgi:molecular chaperone GrpE (heat shock protein)
MAEKKTSKTKSKGKADEAASADEVATVDEAAADEAATDGAGGASDPEQIEGEIEQTREDLGETVAALAEKADVKKQAKQKVDETKERAQATATATADAAKQTFQSAPDKVSQSSDRALAVARENPAAVAGAAIGLLLLVVVLRRRRG